MLSPGITNALFNESSFTIGWLVGWAKWKDDIPRLPPMWAFHTARKRVMSHFIANLPYIIGCNLFEGLLHRTIRFAEVSNFVDLLTEIIAFRLLDRRAYVSIGSFSQQNFLWRHIPGPVTIFQTHRIEYWRSSVKLMYINREVTKGSSQDEIVRTRKIKSAY